MYPNTVLHMKNLQLRLESIYGIVENSKCIVRGKCVLMFQGAEHCHCSTGTPNMQNLPRNKCIFVSSCGPSLIYEMIVVGMASGKYVATRCHITCIITQWQLICHSATLTY